MTQESVFDVIMNEIKGDDKMSKAYCYGSEVKVRDYHLNRNGLPMAWVDCIDAGWRLEVPVSVITIEHVGA